MNDVEPSFLSHADSASTGLNRNIKNVEHTYSHLISARVEIYLNGFHSRVAAEAIRDAVATVNAGNKATREANAIAIADRLRAIAKSLNAMADGIIAKT